MTPIILEVLKETLSIGDKKEKVKKKKRKKEKQTNNNNMSTTKKLSILFLLEEIYIYIYIFFFFLRKCFHRTLFLLPLEFPNWNGININIIIILAI